MQIGGLEMTNEYYIISFRNERTGEFKEYYQCISTEAPEDIETKARKMRDVWFSKDVPITIRIYKAFKTIYDGE